MDISDDGVAPLTPQAIRRDVFATGMAGEFGSVTKGLTDTRRFDSSSQGNEFWNLAMDGHDPVVMQAIKNVIEKHLIDGWSALPAPQRVQAIYDEIRRLDENRMKAQARAPVAADLAVA